MPLLDHFHPPLNNKRLWGGFLFQWANSLVSQLNKSLLPKEFIALPHVTVDPAINVTMAPGPDSGGLQTLVYAPAKPALVFPVDFAGLETYEVQVFVEEGGLRLVGAIELVSPANKDRPSHRHAFVRKCATYLQEGVSLIIVDVVTLRSGNFHAALVVTLAPGIAVTLNEPDQLYAVAYRNVAGQQQMCVEAWPEALQIGQPLPTLPLWLGVDVVVPVDLEQSYLATCDTLRLREGPHLLKA